MGVFAGSAVVTIGLGIFMLLDARKARERDDLASKITRAVDRTALANGLKTRPERIWAMVFLICLLTTAVLGVWILQSRGFRSWSF